MKRFFSCFNASKHNNYKRFHLKHVAADSENPLLLESTTVEIPITESKEKKVEKQLSFNGETKVTSFDSNNAKIDKAALSPDKAATDLAVIHEVKEDENEQEPSNPKNQAYSKQEFDDGNGNGSGDLVEEESSDSLFSLSIDSRKRTCGGEVGEKEVSSPMPRSSSNGNSRERNQTRSVLSPLETHHLPQLKIVKATTLQHQEKENINSQQDNATYTCSFELSSKKGSANRDVKKVSSKEIAVETSLSTWLIETDTTPLSKGSTNSVGNSPAGSQGRRILGALTVKKSPGSTTPTQRNSLSSDDTSILGTVGSYWRHTGQRVDSDSSSSSKGMLKKYAEDERKKWNSEPFEAKLDRALEKIVAKI